MVNISHHRSNTADFTIKIKGTGRDSSVDIIQGQLESIENGTAVQGKLIAQAPFIAAAAITAWMLWGIFAVRFWIAGLIGLSILVWIFVRHHRNNTARLQYIKTVFGYRPDRALRLTDDGEVVFIEAHEAKVLREGDTETAKLVNNSR
jgi:hypothetical protein